MIQRLQGKKHARDSELPYILNGSIYNLQDNEMINFTNSNSI